MASIATPLLSFKIPYPVLSIIQLRWISTVVPVARASDQIPRAHPVNLIPSMASSAVPGRLSLRRIPELFPASIPSKILSVMLHVWVSSPAISIPSKYEPPPPTAPVTVTELPMKLEEPPTSARWTAQPSDRGLSTAKLLPVIVKSPKLALPLPCLWISMTVALPVISLSAMVTPVTTADAESFASAITFIVPSVIMLLLIDTVCAVAFPEPTASATMFIGPPWISLSSIARPDIVTASSFAWPTTFMAVSLSERITTLLLSIDDSPTFSRSIPAPTNPSIQL